MKLPIGRLIALAGMGAGMLIVAMPAAAQILETETARPVGKGILETSGNFEYQTSSEGHEVALPFAIEYGISDRLEFLVEPVAYTAIRPNVGPQATGAGDLETTLTYLFHRETGAPALALAGEVKFPTTNDTLISTGKTDYTAYLIGSKRFGRLDTHADIGYTVVGKPAGAQLKNIWNFAFGWERTLGSSTELYGEFIGNTAASATPEASGPPPPGTTSPEAPSGEFVTSLGIAQYVVPSLRLSLGLSIDNNSAVLFRPGFTLRTHQ
ncbi:MAG TPA: hypothetical protein VGN76_08815 [Gemmatimonadales bacterium]|nr:hypothetical protein [Gemmatimonadales bacterium]